MLLKNAAQVDVDFVVSRITPMGKGIRNRHAWACNSCRACAFLCVCGLLWGISGLFTSKPAFDKLS